MRPTEETARNDHETNTQTDRNIKQTKSKTEIGERAKWQGKTS